MDEIGDEFTWEVLLQFYPLIPAVHKKKKKLENCHDKIGLSLSSGFNTGQNI